MNLNRDSWAIALTGCVFAIVAAVEVDTDAVVAFVAVGVVAVAVVVDGIVIDFEFVDVVVVAIDDAIEVDVSDELAIVATAADLNVDTVAHYQLNSMDLD